MSNKFLPLAWLLSLGLLLAGCGSSPPNNFYVLSAHAFPAPSGVAPALGVGPISIPEYLGRQNMVYNRVENTVQVAGQDMWAEPLGDGIQRVLVLNLTGLLNTQSVTIFPWRPERAPEFGIEVNLLQLDANENEALLTADWLVYRPGNAGPGSRRISRLRLPLPPGAPEPEQVAAAYSTLLFQLSEIIAAAIASDRTAGSHTAAP
jgi:uncharacterized lipoprotein YmbA